MPSDRLIRAENAFPVSLTASAGLVLLIIGVAAIVSMAFQIGPLT